MEKILDRARVNADPKKSVTFRLDIDEADRFKEVCKKNGTSASRVINVFIKDLNEEYL